MEKEEGGTEGVEKGDGVINECGHWPPCRAGATSQVPRPIWAPFPGHPTARATCSGNLICAPFTLSYFYPPCKIICTSS